MTFTKKMLFAVVAVVVLGAMYLVLPKTSVPEMTSAENIAGGFMFEYPQTLELNQYESGVSAVGEIQEEQFITYAELVRRENDHLEAYESYKSFLFDSARMMCAADGPTGSIECTSLLQEQPFTTTAGVDGYVFYLERRESNFTTGTSTQSLWGPIFAIPTTSTATEPYGAVMVYPPLLTSAEEVRSNLLRTVAESIEVGDIPESAYGLMGYIRGISMENMTITVDDVEWLQGEEAIQAVVDDTPCTIEDVYECEASLSNNFYIRNTSTSTEVYAVSKRGEGTLLHAGDLVGFQELAQDYERMPNLQTYPFRFQVNALGEVIFFEQVYLP